MARPPMPIIEETLTTLPVTLRLLKCYIWCFIPRKALFTFVFMQRSYFERRAPVLALCSRSNTTVSPSTLVSTVIDLRCNKPDPFSDKLPRVGQTRPEFYSWIFPTLHLTFLFCGVLHLVMNDLFFHYCLSNLISANTR